MTAKQLFGKTSWLMAGIIVILIAGLYFCYILRTTYYSINECKLTWDVASSTGTRMINFNRSRNVDAHWYSALMRKLGSIGHEIDVYFQKKTFSAADVDGQFFLSALEENKNLKRYRFLMSWGHSEIFVSNDAHSFFPTE